MSQPKGLRIPNGKRILELRNEKRWSVEKLAEVAEIDARSVEGAERGERKQHNVLYAIAKTLEVSLSEIVIDEMPDDQSWPSHSRIQVHKGWEQSWSAIEQAQEEILIIDSFFSEFAHLGMALGKNAAQRKKSLSLSMYMASPQKDFGAQRVREKDLPNDDKTDLFALLIAQTTKRERKDYETTFHTFEIGIKQHVGRHNVIVDVFEYICMPSLRIIVVDQIQFFFGWFPLANQNPGHICFHLRNEALNAADAELREKLDVHIDRVRRLSTPTMRKY
jgi:transcriptional regulator with XRE-family HTH domain